MKSPLFPPCANAVSLKFLSNNSFPPLRFPRHRTINSSGTLYFIINYKMSFNPMSNPASSTLSFNCQPPLSPLPSPSTVSTSHLYSLLNQISVSVNDEISARANTAVSTLKSLKGLHFAVKSYTRPSQPVAALLMQTVDGLLNMFSTRAADLQLIADVKLSPTTIIEKHQKIRTICSKYETAIKNNDLADSPTVHKILKEYFDMETELSGIMSLIAFFQNGDLSMVFKPSALLLRAYTDATKIFAKLTDTQADINNSVVARILDIPSTTLTPAEIFTQTLEKPLTPEPSSTTPSGNPEKRNSHKSAEIANNPTESPINESGTSLVVSSEDEKSGNSNTSNPNQNAHIATLFHNKNPAMQPPLPTRINTNLNPPSVESHTNSSVEKLLSPLPTNPNVSTNITDQQLPPLAKDPPEKTNENKPAPNPFKSVLSPTANKKSPIKTVTSVNPTEIMKKEEPSLNAKKRNAESVVVQHAEYEPPTKQNPAEKVSFSLSPEVIIMGTELPDEQAKKTVKTADPHAQEAPKAQPIGQGSAKASNFVIKSCTPTRLFYTTAFTTRLAAERYFKPASPPVRSQYANVKESPEAAQAKPVILLEFKTPEDAMEAEKLYYPAEEYSEWEIGYVKEMKQ